MGHIDTALNRRQRVKRLMILSMQDRNTCKVFQAQHLIDRIDLIILSHINNKQFYKAA